MIKVKTIDDVWTGQKYISYDSILELLLDDKEQVLKQDKPNKQLLNYLNSSIERVKCLKEYGIYPKEEN